MQNYDLNNLYEWPLVPKLIVIILVSFFIFYMGYLLDTKPLKISLATEINRQDELMSQYKKALSEQLHALSDIEKVPQLKALLVEWQSKMIAKSNLSSLLENVITIGESNQLQFSLFDPGVESKVDQYSKIPVKINTRGNYNQIASFMSQVANMNKLIVLSDFTLDRSAENIRDSSTVPINSELPFNADITLDVYQR